MQSYDIEKKNTYGLMISKPCVFGWGVGSTRKFSPRGGRTLEIVAPVGQDFQGEGFCGTPVVAI